MQMEKRLVEAAKFGFKRAVVPAGDLPKSVIKGLKIFPCATLLDALYQVAPKEAWRNKKGRADREEEVEWTGVYEFMSVVDVCGSANIVCW